MGIFREDNDCMLAKDSLIKNNGTKDPVMKTEAFLNIPGR